jgi:hypothetical protein
LVIVGVCHQPQVCDHISRRAHGHCFLPSTQLNLGFSDLIGWLGLGLFAAQIVIGFGEVYAWLGPLFNSILAVRLWLFNLIVLSGYLVLVNQWFGSPYLAATSILLALMGIGAILLLGACPRI